MRDTIKNISLLQTQINDLQLENQILKNILNDHGISYHTLIQNLKNKNPLTDYDPEQGKRIKHPAEITEEMAVLFYSRFWGRQDVYAKRYENSKNGKVGYYTQCHNFWKYNCPIKQGNKIRCKDCKNQVYKRLTKKDILGHLNGSAYDSSDVIGVYPLLSDGRTRFLVFDFDNHSKGAADKDFANEDDEWIEEVEAMRKICVLNGLDPLVERSRSGRGAHIWIFFDGAISAKLARRFGNGLLDKGAEQINMKSFKYYDRMLPAQDRLTSGGLGNLIALPLQGRALKDGNSAFIDENWNAYPNQWQVFMSKPRLSQEFVELKLKEWESYNLPEDNEIRGERGEKPWKKNKQFSKNDVEGKISITLSNGIYIDSLNLSPSIQNRIRRMAAISNPEFYKNEAIGTSNYETSRWIYLGRDHLNGYIEIPRGLYDELLDQINQSEIPCEIEDERQNGRKINASFKGELREEQTIALAEMMKHDSGILHAATAFGKTVVCSAMIAEKKVNTLILLQSSSLVEQWEKALQTFLSIEERLPTYKTKTGRVKTRKSVIGKIHGAHDSATGIIDIAMAGSLRKKGELHPFLKEYGMIIVDECHHAASDTISDILKEVDTKYIYGVTATPKRSDGLEKINYMYFGPIRHKYTAKEQSLKQDIDHLVYPRFTRTVPPRRLEGKIHPNEAYHILRENDMRDEQIIKDVEECITNGRTPVILSRYKDHSERLFERLKNYADHVFYMTGNNKKEHKLIRNQMEEIPSEETMILIATGKLIGEGFDYPRLDTLIMAMPVSFESVVAQYAGRLNREYEGKRDVIIYDYIDSHIPMFENMYLKRLKAYKQIGYSICSGMENEKQKAGSIFDGENYKEVYQKDLLEANKSIIISSPVISGPKVDELIQQMKNKQYDGVEITVITWEPDSYSFGKSDYWMQLHDELRTAGLYVKTVNDKCYSFAIIDQRIVWYGNMNLLGKEKIEDSMMRVDNKEAANELLELSFTIPEVL